MIERIDSLAARPTIIVAVPLAAPAAEGTAGDAVVLTTAGDLRGKALDCLAKAQQLRTESTGLEQKATSKELEAQLLENEARSKNFEAALAEQQAAQARRDAEQAQEEEKRAQQKAEETRAQADAKKAEAFQQEQQAALAKAQGENILANGDAERFDQGIYLLTLADAGFEKEKSLNSEAVNLQSNVQASLDLAESCKATAASKSQQKTGLEQASQESRHQAEEKLQLSERAQAAADALKLDAGGRREAAEKLISQGAACAELADLGDRVQDGFLVSP